VQVLPDGWLADGAWKPYALAAGGMWLAVRLAELRQMRRTNGALLAERALAASR
jgi:hypothetical protein